LEFFKAVGDVSFQVDVGARREVASSGTQAPFTRAHPDPSPRRIESRPIHTKMNRYSLGPGDPRKGEVRTQRTNCPFRRRSLQGCSRAEVVCKTRTSMRGAREWEVGDVGKDGERWLIGLGEEEEGVEEEVDEE
jgi:hypothetical protein